MTGPDHFSSQSSDYSLYRPTYPGQLFKYMASLSPSRELAWDCGTGNGQAAIDLSRYFRRVIASDTSAAQIDKAQPHEKIDYRVASAENSGIDSNCIDLILVAQALHWFDFELFYLEAKRVLKPEGVLAAVSYQLPRINPDIDAIIDEFHDDLKVLAFPVGAGVVPEKVAEGPRLRIENSGIGHELIRRELHEVFDLDVLVRPKGFFHHLDAIPSIAGS